ncbi:MAG: hypothetical protein DMG59_08450 [Acidobacteria bacterium]|jgi:hypothetical protein|nr:MAG: hypothetical protein DMG59_08450 [Acidobacteriota bacterium]
MNTAGDDREVLATRYLRHTALGGLEGKELDEAEMTYVLWDWDSLASLAYEQFLKHGRGVFIGPRTAIHEDSITVAFDYVPNRSGLLAEILTFELSTSLWPVIEHYHPEFDFIVVWLRKDGTARYAVLRCHEKPGFRSPRDLYELRPRVKCARPN